MRHIRPKTILIKAPNWIGDVMMALPALSAIRRDNPEAKLILYLHKKLEPLAQFFPWIDEVKTHGAARNPFEWIQWIRSVQRTGAEVGILCSNSFKSALLTRLGGVPWLSGLSREGRHWLLKHPVSTTGELAQKHRLQWYARLCEPLLDHPVDQTPSLIVSKKDQERLKLSWPRTRPAIAVAVGAAYGPAKEYGLERFSQVVELLGEKGFQVVVVGTLKEATIGETLKDRFPQTVTNFAGQTTLDELVILLSQLEGYVGNDSGPMHLSAALGKPTIGIYGPTDPTWVGPVGLGAQAIYEKQECSPCYLRACPLAGDQYMCCMKAITPVQIVDRFLKAFESQKR